MKDFQLTGTPDAPFRGYVNKKDITNLGVGYLIPGSQNVLSNDGERIAIRQGYTLDGQADSTIGGTDSSWEYEMHTGDIRILRAGNTVHQVRYVDSAGIVTWLSLQTALSSTRFNYAPWWDSTLLQSRALWVDGTSNIYEWSGGMGTLLSATANSITFDGSLTSAELGFYTSGNHNVLINGTTYAYTGGHGTTTLTGVTPSPAAEAVGSVILQKPEVTANSAIPDLPDTLKNSLISTLGNQIYVASLVNRTVYISKVNNYKDFAFGSPVRITGEGGSVTLDANPVALVPQEEEMYISAGQDQWYRVEFKLISDNGKEELKVKRLKTSAQQGAKAQGLVTKVKNDVVFVSNEPTLDSLGRIINVTGSPQTVSISDAIKADFDIYDFTDGHAFYAKNTLHVALPQESILLIRNLEKGFWEAPQVLPAGRLTLINGEVYLHSNSVLETYKLFDGNTDNGNPINGVARFAYHNYGRRDWMKEFDEFFTEGYISTNTILNLKLYYDYQGATTIRDFDIAGSDDDIIFGAPGVSSLGEQSLGEGSLGGESPEDDERIANKFRVIRTTSSQPFYELLVEYSTTETGVEWEILVFGPNARLSKSDNAHIKR